jgi:hypothetical protein
LAAALFDFKALHGAHHGVVVLHPVRPKKLRDARAHNQKYPKVHTIRVI